MAPPQHPSKESQQVLTEWECNKYLMNKINEVANREIPPPMAPHREILSVYQEPTHHMQTGFRRPMVLVMGGWAHATSKGPWNHLLSLAPSLPTVEKHLIPPLNNRFRSGRSDGGSNLLHSNFDWPWCYFLGQIHPVDTGPDPLRIRLYILLCFTNNVILSAVFAQQANSNGISSSTLSLRGDKVFGRLWCQRWLFRPLPDQRGVLSSRLSTWITTSGGGGIGRARGRRWERQKLLNITQESCLFSILV